MAGVDTAFATGDQAVRAAVAVPVFKNPAVLKARLAKAVSFHKRRYFPPDAGAADPDRRDFWVTMANSFGVSKASIVSDHNRLRVDPRVTASEELVTGAERATLHAVTLNGTFQNNQLLLFEARIGPLGDHVRFEDEFEPAIHSEVYLVVDTEHLEQETIIASLKLGEIFFSSLDLDASLEVRHEGSKKTSLEIKVGAFSTDGANAHIVNRADFENMAIAKVRILNSLTPGPVLEATDMQSDIIALLDDVERPKAERGYAKVYLHIDAHTKNTHSNAEKKVQYRGGARNRSQEFWKGDGIANAKDHGQPWIKLRAGWYDPVQSPQRLLYGSSGYRPIAGAFGERIRWRLTRTVNGVVVQDPHPHPHQGVDVFAPLGTPLYSCVDGTVVQVVNHSGNNYTANANNVELDWYHSERYGNLVVIELKHPQDLTTARRPDYPLNRRDLYLGAPNVGEPPLSQNEGLVPAHRRMPASARVPAAEAAMENNMLLEVEHGPGWAHNTTRYVMYAHMREVHVAPNDQVFSGQLIGTSGKSGNARDISLQSNRHLHFEVRSKHPPGGSTENRTNPAYYINWVTLDPSHRIEDQRDKRDPNPIPSIQDSWKGNVRATDRKIAQQNPPT